MNTARRREEWGGKKERMNKDDPRFLIFLSFLFPVPVPFPPNRTLMNFFHSFFVRLLSVCLGWMAGGGTKTICAKMWAFYWDFLEWRTWLPLGIVSAF